MRLTASHLIEYGGKIGAHGPLAAGANLLLDSLARGYMTDFSAPPGAGKMRAICAAAKEIGGASFISRRQDMRAQFILLAGSLNCRARAFGFVDATIDLEECSRANLLIIFCESMVWDGIVQSIADEFMARGNILVRVR